MILKRCGGTISEIFFSDRHSYFWFLHRLSVLTFACFKIAFSNPFLTSLLEWLGTVSRSSLIGCLRIMWLLFCLTSNQPFFLRSLKSSLYTIVINLLLKESFIGISTTGDTKKHLFNSYRNNT